MTISIVIIKLLTKHDSPVYRVDSSQTYSFINTIFTDENLLLG